MATTAMICTWECGMSLRHYLFGAENHQHRFSDSVKKVGKSPLPLPNHHYWLVTIISFQIANGNGWSQWVPTGALPTQGS